MTRILVVEDSATQAKALELILTSEGYDVCITPNAEKGLERMAETTFDLVISDIVMPGISGYDLCRQAKANHATREVPVILLTTLSDPLDIIQGLESGADNFITKPYEGSQLVGRVETILTNRRLRTERESKEGVEIFFLGRRFTIASEKEQILDLLLSTFEDTVRTNRELRASQNALSAANRELESFSYSVSHDLRSPLRAIDGFSQALIDDWGDKLDAEGRSNLDRVRDAVQRMSQLIDDLLGLARVARSEIRRADVNLSAVALTILDRLQATHPERRVDLVVHEGVRASGDARLLTIVLENLIGNAWKFTAKREHPTIEFGRNEQGPTSVYFIRDNGAGLDMRFARKLFGAFQRFHSADEFEGTGIGLAIVQRVVQRHGGRAWAESVLGAGATFYFTLEGEPEAADGEQGG
ncbi:MAG: sensor histidine kinase [Polyangiaceae bacterium]